MSEEKEPLKLGQQEAIPSEPVRIETEDIFDADLVTPESDPFQDNPMKIFASLVGDLKDMARSPMAIGILPPPSEHKVKIFRFDEKMIPAQVCAEIETLLNDGWSCHHPIVINDYVIIDFSRRKESEEDGSEG